MIKPIPIANLQQSGQERLGGSMPIAMNVVMDGRGVVMKRPGMATYSEAPTTVVDSSGLQGIWGTHNDRLYAVSDATTVAGAAWRNVYRLTSGSANKISNVAGEEVRGGAALRPVFAETEALLVVACGNLMQKIAVTTDASSRLGGTPPEASHVVLNSSRLLANDVTVDLSKVRYSDPASGTTTTGHETWAYGGAGTSGFFSAEARSDPIQAVGENTNEVFVWGTTNFQIFVPDVMLRYANVTTKEYGLVAPYSVIKVEQHFAWLDHHRRFVMSDGRQFDVLSDDIQVDLNNISTVDDCFGYRFKQGAVDCLVWTFPTDERTFVYQKGIGWGQWAGWNTTDNNWTRLTVNCHFHRNDTDVHVVGTTDGKVAQLDLDTYDDLGTSMPAYVETGYIARDTGKKKWCKNVIATIRRGNTSSSTAPVARLSFSDDPGFWSAPVEISLGVGGDTTSVVPLGAMGVYRSRAWRFEFSPTEYLALVSLEEDYEVLDY